MTDKRLTTTEYWDAGYTDRSHTVPLAIDDFRQLWARRLVEIIESVGMENRSVLEVGAGDSAVLTCLAGRHRQHATFAGLDYSESGCRMLTARAAAEGVDVDVYHQDMFSPAPELHDRFDLLFSLGVVEHFDNLPSTLESMARLLSPGGQMLTVIPNMAGILGTLTRRYNRAVFELHVAHTIQSLRQGHLDAHLAIEDTGYICSTNFGILSSCFESDAAPGWRTFKWLSRLSKLFWFFEARTGDFPHTAQCSPYIYVLSRKPR